MKSIKIKSHGGLGDTHKHILRCGLLDYRLAFCKDGIGCASIDTDAETKYWNKNTWQDLLNEFPQGKVVFNLEADENLDFVGWWIPIKEVQFDNLDDFVAKEV